MLIAYCLIFVPSLKADYDPCPEVDDDTPWGETMQTVYCYDDVVPQPWSAAEFQCESYCCYYISYQERWVNGNEYELQIVDIQVTDDENCSDCIHMIISHFYHDRIREKSEEMELEFYNRTLSTGRTSIYEDTYIYVYHKAKCMDANAEPCDSEFRCCKNKIHIDFRGGLYDDKWVVQDTYYQINDDIFPLCDTNCTPKCGEYMITENPCDIDCNTGEWITEPIPNTMNVTGCPGCVITYFYSTRTTSCNGIIYKDARLDHYYTSGCENCLWNYNDLYTFIVADLLHYSGHEMPQDDGNCIEDYRIISAGCWEFDPNDLLHLIPCDEEKCCYSHWRICNVGGELVDQNMDGDYYVECENNCIAFCAELPSKFPTDISSETDNRNDIDVNVSPNPGSDYIRFNIKTAYQGYFKLTIYDNSGNAVKSNLINKSDNNFEYKISMDIFGNGAYNYKIEIPGYSVFNGKFIINK